MNYFYLLTFFFRNDIIIGKLFKKKSRVCSWFAKIFVIIVSPTVFTFCNKILEMEESSCLVTQYSNFNLTSNQVIYALCMQLFPHKTYCFSSESQMQFEMTRLLHIAHTHTGQKLIPFFHTVYHFHGYCYFILKTAECYIMENCFYI